jgi:ATP-binding cassette subfamily F protein 3
MISATNITLQFGGRILFNNISLRIGPHDRIGLVGSNGAGKSTLLRMLLGEQSPDTGEIVKAKHASVGYLPQEGVQTSGATLYAAAQAVFDDVLRIQDDLEDIHQRMAELDHETEEFQDLLALYGELQHRLEDGDAFRIQSTIEKVLVGLGFSESDFQRPTEHFSGGWQMRIALARLLLKHPALLLLDEPTNHLDLESLQWLEEYLNAYEGAVMIVSHDSRFLDVMTKKTYDLSLGKLVEYSGNFTFYLKARVDRLEQQRAAYSNQQRQIKQTERFIERFRYKATKARQVQSRIKALEKLELVELEDEEDSIHFAFPRAPASGRSVLELRNIRKSYDGNVLFDGLSYDVERGDRIAFVGPNGAGKSTLARILAGVEVFENGERRTGHNVAVAYFAQHQAEELDPSLDVLETVDKVASGDIRKRLRTLLGSFLFKGDDVFKKVGVLSGGEKSRLALAKMLLQPSNLIILDEPTNHLDMRSKAVLMEALLSYEGSCIVVSHDRDFLDPLVNKVVEFRDGNIRTFPGNVSEYIERRKLEELSIEPRGKADAIQPLPSPKERKRIEAEERQRRYARTKPLKEKLQRLEKIIEEREHEKQHLEKALSDPEFYKNGDKVREATDRYAVVERELTESYFQWNNLTRELETVESEDASGGTR